ncbi:hypothetical protein RclHR1_06950002 [Rhizophagus clarus]|uniref:Uncharacterized protein n=1 Tax=Rhizophagus clarus TaxID=94130 RepID=A0A2Z6RU96_9GLOM|nr:hypothetical protein RclHR1_06950002 [Rhizophagus clarus]GES87347.1 hypothetical protein RCL_e24026_RclHR1_06950002 [Rhizophagus clarus]
MPLQSYVVICHWILLPSSLDSSPYPTIRPCTGCSFNQLAPNGAECQRYLASQICLFAIPKDATYIVPFTALSRSHE